MTAHRPVSSAMCSNDDIDWPVHSLMLSFHDSRGQPLWRLPSTVPCSMTFGSESWRQTWPNHDSLKRSTVKASDVRRGYWIVAIHIRLFYDLCMTPKHSPVTFIFKGLDSPPQIHWQRRVLTSLRFQNLLFQNVNKTMFDYILTMVINVWV